MSCADAEEQPSSRPRVLYVSATMLRLAHTKNQLTFITKYQSNNLFQECTRIFANQLKLLARQQILWNSRNLLHQLIVELIEFTVASFDLKTQFLSEKLSSCQIRLVSHHPVAILPRFHVNLIENHFGRSVVGQLYADAGERWILDVIWHISASLLLPP